MQIKSAGQNLKQVCQVTEGAPTSLSDMDFIEVASRIIDLTEDVCQKSGFANVQRLQDYMAH